MLAALGDKLPNCVINLHVGTYEDISNLAALKTLMYHHFHSEIGMSL